MEIKELENRIINADCLNILKQLPDKCIDMILCDLPYGVLNKKNESAKWDAVIPFKPLWEAYERIIKDDGAIVLTASGMFTAELMLSNKKLWRYNLVWKKGNRVSGFLNAKRQPMRNHEDICVFSKKQTKYNPQMTIGNKNHLKGGGNHKNTQRCYGNFKDMPTIQTNEKYPLSVIEIDKEFPQVFHPTQKPVALFEYLIKTYTNENDLVLDNCSGSGTTAIACMHTNRRFICIEKDPEYWKASCKRLEDEQRQGTLF
jgi:DNA modification methylase